VKENANDAFYKFAYTLQYIVFFRNLLEILKWWKSDKGTTNIVPHTIVVNALIQ